MAVTASDIGVQLGILDPSPLQNQQWQSWISQALYLIGKRLTVTDLDSNDVDYVVLQSVVRHARHPEDSTRVQVSVDDASSSRTYSSAVGRVVIPDDLWGILDPDMANESGVGSTRLFGVSDSCTSDAWTSTTACG